MTGKDGEVYVYTYFSERVPVQAWGTSGNGSNLRFGYLFLCSSSLPLRIEHTPHHVFQVVYNSSRGRPPSKCDIVGTDNRAQYPLDDRSCILSTDTKRTWICTVILNNIAFAATETSFRRWLRTVATATGHLWRSFGIWTKLASRCI